MFGERGYLTFPTRATARKPPQGFVAWCCSCCCPSTSEEETGGAEVIHVCPEAEENFDEGEGMKVAVQKMEYGPPTGRRYSCEKRVGLRVVKRGHASTGEKWRHNKDSVEGREVGVPMLKYQPSDRDRYEDGAGGGRGMQIPEIRVHRAQDGDEGI